MEGSSSRLSASMGSSMASGRPVGWVAEKLSARVGVSQSTSVSPPRGQFGLCGGEFVCVVVGLGVHVHVHVDIAGGSGPDWPGEVDVERLEHGGGQVDGVA